MSEINVVDVTDKGSVEKHLCSLRIMVSLLYDRVDLTHALNILSWVRLNVCKILYIDWNRSNALC